MKHLLALSEALVELELPCGGPAEILVSAEGNYDEAHGMLALTLDSSLRPQLDAGACVRPAWLPGPQLLQEHVEMEEATTLARDIFRHWVEKVRRAIPDHEKERNYMKTPNPRRPSRRVVMSTAAALFAGVALIAIPKVASYPRRDAPRVTETAPARHNPSLRQGLPFSASEVEAYFAEALGTQPRRERNTATFINPPGEPMENTFAVSVKTEERGVAVIFTGRGDYAMTLAREFFEAPFFNREESVRFYAMLTHPNVDQTAPLARFTVHFRVVDHPDDFHLTMRFNPAQL